MTYPTSMMGWLQAAAVMTVLLTAWTGFGLSLLRRYINGTISDVVRTSIDTAMQPVQLQLTTMNGELSRVRVIEEKINNGLEKRQERIEVKMDTLIDHFMWDGGERRTQ